MDVLLSIAILLNIVLYAFVFSGLGYSIFNIALNKMDENKGIFFLSISYMFIVNMVCTFMIVCLLIQGGF